MPTRLLLEGGDLQELLAQVREEHGTRAKIVSAERVRAGGLTGLLRAERYELTVELSDDEPAEAPVAVGAPPPGPAGPAVRAAVAPSAASGAASGPASSGTRTAGGPGTAGRPETGNRPGFPGKTSSGNAARPAAAPASRQANAPAIAARPAAPNGTPEPGPDVDELLALLDQREAAEPDSASVGGFDEVLAELRGAQGTNGTVNGTTNGTANGTSHGPANGTVNGTTNGTSHGPANGTVNGAAHAPSSQHIQPTPAVRAEAGALSAAIESALPAVLRQESSPTSAETVDFSMDPIFAPAKSAPEAPPVPAAARTGVPAPGSAPPQTAPEQTAPAPARPAPAQPAQTAPAQSASAQSPNVGPTGATRATTARSTANPARTRPLSPDPRRPNHFLSYGELETIPSESPLPQKLADLGLPQRVLDRLPLGEAYPSIVRALLDEPAPPPLPTGPGMIITIIGELAGALAVAEDVARILRLDADRILIASESPTVGRHIADPGDAGRQAARLRGGDQPRLVCIDAPSPTGWVQQVVIALRPDAVWCAVDATRKPADVARQLRSLPRVDALAVHAVEATADPASPLALGVPVALLDGQPAGPHGWAGLLCRRLFEEEFCGGDR